MSNSAGNSKDTIKHLRCYDEDMILYENEKLLILSKYHIIKLIR